MVFGDVSPLHLVLVLRQHQLKQTRAVPLLQVCSCAAFTVARSVRLTLCFASEHFWTRAGETKSSVETKRQSYRRAETCWTLVSVYFLQLCPCKNQEI